MATNTLYIIFLTAMLASLFYGTAFAINIEITPGVFDKIKNDDVHISCLQNGQVSAAKEILALEIKKDGKPVVVIRQNSQLSYSNVNDTHFKAVGHVDKDMKRSYLNLTLETPQSEDSGIYTCVIVYLDKIDVIRVEQDSKNLTEKKLDLHDIQASLQFLKQKIQSVKKNFETRTSLKEQKQDLQITTLQNRIFELEKKETQNSLNDQKQKNRISELEEKANYTSAFFATNKNYINIKNGDTVVFETVLMKHGDGYNETSGVFTAPKPGLYAFHLYAEIGGSDPVPGGELDLKVNDKRVATLYAKDKDYGDQSSVSVLVDLQTGDEVKVVVYSASGSVPYIYTSNLSGFSGYVIKQP